MLPHAPGVQMQAIPEDAVQEDSGDEEEEDPNKRISSKYRPVFLVCGCLIQLLHLKHLLTFSPRS